MITLFLVQIEVSDKFFSFEIEEELFQDAVELAKIWILENENINCDDYIINVNGDHIGIGTEKGKITRIQNALMKKHFSKYSSLEDKLTIKYGKKLADKAILWWSHQSEMLHRVVTDPYRQIVGFESTWRQEKFDHTIKGCPPAVPEDK